MSENNNYKFKPNVVAKEVNKKLFIKRLPEWMQQIEQIQLFCEDVIQHWLTPESQKLVDGYIGDKSSPAAKDKIFLSDGDIERDTYQLAPVYVSKNNDLSVRSLQFYSDLLGYMKLYGAKTEDENRLLSGNFYSFLPPVNPNKMLNFGSYYWDTENKYNITEPSYYVMQRGAVNGNIWSIQNFWYSYGQTLPDGTIFDESMIGSSRFVRAKAPIIEYFKNIELVNYGTIFRGEVDLLSTNIKPEDIVQHSIADNIRIDGEIIKAGDRILFTSIGNNGENNRIYKVYIKLTDDKRKVYGVMLDESEQSPTRKSGEPKDGDVVLIKRGNNYKNKTFYWNKNKWIETQNKDPNLNNKPLFKLYDKDGVPLDNLTKYPNSNFKGSHIFTTKENFSYPLDSVYNEHVELSQYNYPVFDNKLSSEIFEYTKLGNKTNITGMYFYKIINLEQSGETSEELQTDWVRNPHQLKQYVKQVPVIEKRSMVKVFDNLYELNKYNEPMPNMFAYVMETKQNYVYALDVSTNSYKWSMTSDDIYQYDTFNTEFLLAQEITEEKGDTIEVKIDDVKLHTSEIEYIKNDKGNIYKIKIIKDSVLNDNSILTIRTFSSNELNRDLGMYEIPLNMKNNPYNDSVLYIHKGDFTEHFNDIINSNITMGTVDDVNDFEIQLEKGLVDYNTGTHIIQHEASLLPLMIHTGNENLDIFKSIMFIQTEYFRFKNNFNKVLLDLIQEDKTYEELPTSELVNIVLDKLNIGKNETFPFYLSQMARIPSREMNFIPQTAQFIGILSAHKPEKHVYVNITNTPVRVNIDHTGVVSKAFIDINGSAKMDDAVYELENRIYNNIHEDFKSPDYRPLLNESDLKETPYFHDTEYTQEEYLSLLNRGYVTFSASKGLQQVQRNYDYDDWTTWNFSGSQYIINGKPDNTIKVKGSWRGIYEDMYGTYRPHTHPWEMLGFTIRPDWFNIEYKPTRVRIGAGDNDYMVVYEALVLNEKGELVPSGLWDTENEVGDVSQGKILHGIHSGTHNKFKRFGKQPFKIIKTGNFANNNEEICTVELISPIELGMIKSDLIHINEPWKLGDLGDVEFAYKNTVMFSFDKVMALLKAKPAMFMNYYYDILNSKMLQIKNSAPQFLYNNTRERLNLNGTTLIHGENSTNILGYQSWVSDYLIYQSKNITANYGNVLRNSGIQIGHKLGGFSDVEKLTFVSDTYGTISQENQYIGMIRSNNIKSATISALKIRNVSNGFVISGYDLDEQHFPVLKPIRNGKKTTIEIGKQKYNYINEYSNTVEYVQYNTLFKNSQELYEFICSYGRYLESIGWIYEEQNEKGETINWDFVAKGVMRWTQSGIGNEKNFEISVTPSATSLKFGSTFGTVQSVTEYVGGLWTLIDTDNNGIRPDEISTTRIGNIFNVKLNEDVDKRIALLRLNIISYEHAIIFDDVTIFGDTLYNPLYGSIYEMLKMYGYITDEWNGRLEAPGFMILEDKTLPNFEKIVNDFTKYYSSEEMNDNNQISDLSNHLIGFQSREYLRNMIIDKNAQVDFYRGYIKEKGTHSSLEKVLRVSKKYNTEQYKAQEEWAFKLGEFGNTTSHKHHQFKLNNKEFVQEPQIFSYNDTDDYNNGINGSVNYSGKHGENDRWIARPKDNIYMPLRVGHEPLSAFPDIGPVTLNEVSYSSKNLNTLPQDRFNYYVEHNDKQPDRVWVFKNIDEKWDIYEVIDTGITVDKIVPFKDPNSSTVVYDDLKLSEEHNLKDSDIIFFYNKNWKYLHEFMREERYYFNMGTAKNVIRLALQYNDEIVYTTDKPKLYVYRSIFKNDAEKEKYRESKYKHSVPNSKLFGEQYIYDSTYAMNSTVLNVYDPINLIFDKNTLNEISYISTVDPAIYNKTDILRTDVWGKEHVGKLWWDTSNAYYLDYNIPILDTDGNVLTKETIEYKRYNWGRLLPYSSIDVYEWVRSPVSPSKWDEYCKTYTKQKNNTTDIPSGIVINLDEYSVFEELNTSTDTYEKYYYFWVKNVIYTPNVLGRNKPAYEIERLIFDPSISNKAWFAPLNENTFIIGNIGNKITDDKSIFGLSYKIDTNENVRHEQYQLCKEGDLYNFNPNIWTSMCNSLLGYEEVNNIKHEISYPKTELGNGYNKIWFKDIINARKAFVDSANQLYERINLTTNQNLMDTIFNYKSVNENPNEVIIKILRINNEYVISPNDNTKFRENEPVLVFSNGTLPSPLVSTSVYFVHITDDGYIKLMSTPSSNGQSNSYINITSKGEGVHTMIKQSEYIENLGTSLDMSRYWELTDWYANGFNKNTTFVREQSIDSANKHNYQENDVIKIIDSDGIWTLYQKQFSRNKVMWTAVARQNSTIKLNELLFSGYSIHDDKGELSEVEINVRNALELIFKTFDTMQSKVVFDMVNYVFSEQKIVDWVFKTSYIYITGLEQSLQQNYIEQSDLISHIVAYYEEVKPYRTKIRSQIEQKTSDEDEINGIINDLDPTGYIFDGETWIKSESDIFDLEYAEFNPNTNRWEVKGSLPTNFTEPYRRFQEIDTILVFDNIQCNSNKDLYSTEILNETNNKFIKYKESKIHYELPMWIHETPYDYVLSASALNVIIRNITEKYPDFKYDANKPLSVNITEYIRPENDIKKVEIFNNDIDEIITEVVSNTVEFKEVSAYVQYNTLANRLQINTNIPNIPEVVGCPFKGVYITDNPSTRLPNGFSSYNNYNNSFVIAEDPMYEHFSKLARNKGIIEDEIDLYIAYEYGLYNINNEQIKSDLVYVMTTVYNKFDETKDDFYEEARKHIEEIYIDNEHRNINNMFISIPKKYLSIDSKTVDGIVKVKYNESINTILDRYDLISISDGNSEITLKYGNNIFYLDETCFDDLPLSEDNPMLSDYKTILTNIHNMPYFNDINAFDMNGYDGGTYQISKIVEGETDDIKDNIFIDISELNPNKIELAELRLTVSGYNDPKNTLDLKDFSHYQVEGSIYMNPYNLGEAFICIPSHEEVMKNMARGVFERTYKQDSYNIRGVQGKNTIILKNSNHNLHVGDEIVIVTYRGGDCYTQEMYEGKFKKIIDVNEIKTESRPTVFKITKVNENRITLDKLNMQSVDYDNEDYLFISKTIIPANIIKVRSFNSPEFSTGKYSENRMYKVNILEYDLYYDRILNSNMTDTNLDLYDAHYVSNEIFELEDGTTLDHGFLLPNTDFGTLPDLVKISPRENLQLFVYEYNVDDINPEFIDGEWEYDYPLMNNLYLPEECKLTVMYKATDTGGTILEVPVDSGKFGIDDYKLVKGVVPYMNSIMFKNGSMVKLMKQNKLDIGQHYTAEIDISKEYEDYGVVVDNKGERYKHDSFAIPYSEFINGYTIDSDMIALLL